jgi:c-di-AMP phosphodiesterase-like protein
MLESREVYDACKQVAVIDHHRKMVNYISRAVIFYHEPFASSASEMVTELIDYISNAPLDRLEADALLSGIMLDTKNFVLKTGVRTFEAAALLRKNGADPVEAKRLFASSFDSYKQKYDFIANAQIHRGMALAVGTESGKDFRVVAAQAADELLNISGVDASFVMFPFGNGINISARSFGRINVQLIMEKIGGGGHLTMAGAQIPGVTPEEARKRVEEAIDAFLADRGLQPEIDGIQMEYGPARPG